MKIVIEGNIGCGKSTLLTYLQNKTRLPVFLESINKWTLLDKFYDNIERYAFSFNLEVLLSMSIWKDNNFVALYERSPVSCRKIFTEMNYENGKIAKEELDLFDKLFETFGWEQDIIIYLETSPEICYERMKKRNRSCEYSVPLDYLQNLHKKHIEMLEYVKNHKPHIKIYKINGNENEESICKNVLKILRDNIIL